VLHGDRAALERLWSEHLTVNAPTNRVNVGRDAVLALIQRGGLHYSVFERTVETVRIEGDVAIVMGAEMVRAGASDSAATALAVYRHKYLEARSRHLASDRPARQRGPAPVIASRGRRRSAPAWRGLTSA